MHGMLCGHPHTARHHGRVNDRYRQMAKRSSGLLNNFNQYRETKLGDLGSLAGDPLAQ